MALTWSRKRMSVRFKNRILVFGGRAMPKVTDAHLEARRQQILDAATECFARKGFHRSTMHDICQMAELSPGAVYRYSGARMKSLRRWRSRDASTAPR